MKKRFVAFLLVLIMVLGMLPVSAMAAQVTGETQKVTYKVLYVSDEFNIGYSYGSSEATTFVCQYSTSHSDSAGLEHLLAIADIKAAADRATVGEGYQIVGWTKKESRDPVINKFPYSLTGKTTLLQGNGIIFLVAKETNPQVTYTLTYDANGGEGAPGQQTAKSSTGSATFTISSQEPIRSGYDFLGWDKSSSATTAVYAKGGSITISTDTTLYAVWQCNHLKDNDGNCTVDGCDHPDSCCPKPEDPNPGTDWPRDPNGTDGNLVVVDCIGKGKHDAASYGLIDGRYEVTNKAYDEESNIYTYTVMVTADEYVKDYNDSLKVAHTLNGNNTKSFDMTWNKETKQWTGVGVTFHVECEEEPPVETFTVTYTDGVDGEEVFPDQVYPDLRKNSTTPAFNGTPNREGYTFAGWEPEVAGTVNENATYTAKWIKLPTAEEIAELGITVNVKCVNETGAEEQKSYPVIADDIEVTGFAASTPLTANFWIKPDRFVDLYSTDTEKTHTKSWPENGGLGWCVYFDENGKPFNPQECDGGLENTGHTNKTIEVKHEIEKFPVHVVIYRNGDTSKAYKTVALEQQPKGHVIDLTTLDIADYYTANYTGEYDFYGWYDDGLWNIYKANVAAGKDAPKGMSEKTVNGWTNIKCMVYDYEKVAYFKSDEDRVAGKSLFETTARKGATLPTADAPTATRDGYTFTFWSREGQIGTDVTGQTVNGWTNLVANWEKKTYKVVAKLYVNGKPAYYQNEDFYTYNVSGLYGENIDFDTIKAEAVEQAKQIKKASASYTAVILEDHEPNPVCTTYGEHQPGQATHYVKVNVKTEEKVVIFQSFEGKTDLTKLRTTTAPYGTNVVEFLNGLGLDLTVAGYTLDTAEGSNTNWYKKDSPEWTFGTNDTINGWTNVLLKYTITPHNIYAFANLTSYFAPLTADEFDTHITLNDATLSRLGLGSYNSLGYIPIGTFDFDEMPLTEDLYMAYYEDPEIDAVAEELAKSIVLETGVTKETALKIVWASLFKNVNKENMELGYPTDDAEGYQFTGNLYLATVAFKAGGDNVKNMPAVNYTYDDFFEIHDFYFPGETVTLTEPTREGYTFKGWSVTVLPGAEDASALSLTGAGDAADDEDLLPAGTVYTVTAGGAIFTAQWELKTYIIASDLRLNGTTVMVVKPDPAKSYPWSHRYGDEFGKTIDYTDMFKTLKEKALEVDAANEPCDVEIELRFPGDKNRDGKLFNEVITTYGQTGGGWNPGNKNTAPIWGYGTSLYEVIFDYDYDDKTDTQIVKYSEKATSVTPTREGYNFLGWFNADGTEFSFDTEITHKTTVTAKWEKKTYTIASDLRINGNVANLEDTGRYAWTHRYGDKYGETIDYQPMFAALKARALAVDAANEPCDAEIELRFPGDKNRDGKLFNEVITTYGQTGGGWNPGNKNTAPIWGYATTSYQVIFDANGGSTVDTKVVKYDEKATEPTAPTKTGYTFDGWYTDDALTIPFSFDTPITRKTTLYAKWTANTYKVKFAANGGEGTMADQNFTYDEEKALNANAFTRAGYTFANWKDAAGNTYTDGQTVKNLTAAANGEVTLTAQWTARNDTPYKVEHYLENLDGSYTLDTTEDLKGTTDTTATATPKTDYANFTYNDTVDGTVASGNIAGDGSLVLKLYYTRNTYTYTIKHIKQLPDGTYDVANAEVETLNGKFEALAAVTAKNYGSHYPTNDAGTKQNIKVVSGLVIEVRYDLDYHTLTFDTMGGSKIDPETVRHGLTVAKPKDPVNGGYWFDGWYTDKTYRTPYNFATPLTQDTTIYAKWFLIVLPGVTVKKAAPKLNTSDHFAYVQGYPNGTVKPAGNITRAETAAILFRLMDDTSRNNYYSTKSGFRDVAAGSWYNTYVATLNNAGVITDSSNGYFRPNEAITRAELAAMLAAFTDTTRAANYFNDVTANYWAANAIAVCAKLGWITGYPDGSFRPDRNVTRAELMAMINRATGRAPKSADAFLPGMKTWSDNTADKWYYLDVQEATNSHSYTVRPTEIWTAITAAPNWSKYE